MQNIKISIATIIILAAMLVLHLYGMEHDLYIRFWFYDIILHILGGVGIAMSVYSVAVFFNIELIKGKLSRIIALTFIAGLAWEAFEVIFNLTGSKVWTTPYYIDTIKDLFNDVIGSIIVYLAIKNK